MLLKNVFKVSSLVKKPNFRSFEKSISSIDRNNHRNNLSYKSIAIVGCGFVADYYLKTLSMHPQLKLVGVMDKISDRAAKFAQYHNVARVYETLTDILEDNTVDIVLNLTNPRSHYQVSKAALEAGKHVYSEKPFAMEMAQAEELVKIAASKGLYLSSAPCSLLSETAQTLWKALRENQVGKVRLVYAEMDDGLVHQMPYQKWLSESGTPWPYKDEFEVGCTLEHAGYYVNWLTAFFGPAETVSAFSSCVVPDKHTDIPLDIDTPDFSVACIKFASGVVARLTCSIVAPHDHSLKIIGDDGILGIDDCWFYGTPVYIRRSLTIGRKRLEGIWKKNYPLVRKAPKFAYRGAQQMDFSRGVAEMVDAIMENRPCRLSSEFSLHNNELVLAIQNSLETGSPYKMTTSFEPVEPMDWAK
ncbi:MAG: Gfo/Idh/MocA family oxidoreductase [Cyanobacteria bacterium J06635_10]